MRAIVGATLLAFSLVAWSDLPASSAAKDAGPQQTKTAKQTQNGAPNRGTPEQSPITIVVSPAVNAQSHAGGEGKQGEEKASENRAVEIVSIALTALATIVVAVFTWRLWSSTDKLWKEATEAGQTAKASTEAARVSADAAQQTARTMHADFIASHRPRLIVRNVALSDIKASPLTITYSIVNIGNTKATITKISAGILCDVGKSLPPSPPYVATVEQNILVNPGYLDPLQFTVNNAEAEQITFRLGFPDGEDETFFFGYIEYEDAVEGPTKRIRRTGFARRLDYATERFVTVKDIPDYEYQD